MPLQVKRGYHRHFKPRGNKVITRPMLDADVGYPIAPMEQGLRLTTGAEFAGVEAPPTPVQFDRLMPKARELFPLGEQVEQTPWMGSRPSFPDSRPVIGRAPGLSDLWLDFGHTHWGLTLGPVSGRLLAEMMTGDDAVLRSQAVSGRALSQEILTDDFAEVVKAADLCIEKNPARGRPQEGVVDVTGNALIEVPAPGDKGHREALRGLVVRNQADRCRRHGHLTQKAPQSFAGPGHRAFAVAVITVVLPKPR